MVIYFKLFVKIESAHEYKMVNILNITIYNRDMKLFYFIHDFKSHKICAKIT